MDKLKDILDVKNQLYWENHMKECVRNGWVSKECGICQICVMEEVDAEL